MQQTAGNDLIFCGFGALADCDCAQSSFDPAHFTTPPAPLTSATSLLIKSSDSFQTISIAQVPDTISSTCGLADGVSKCGPRSYYFKDKLTGL